MLFILDVIFYFLILLLAFSYFGYPVFISVLQSKGRTGNSYIDKETIVHLLIPCYNEENVIEEKIRNSFEIDYPCAFNIYVIIDKSDDNTSKIAHDLTNEYPNLIVLDKVYRKGKNDSLNYFYENVKPKGNDVLFMTDANTFYEKDSFMFLWKELCNGAVVVGGSMKYIEKETNSAKSEGLYWKYEEWIRRNEDRFGRAISMNGGNMAMLAKYFKELPLFVPNDFFIPISLVSKYKTSFASESIGIEKAILNEREELKRKRRMANRQMNAIIIGWGNFSVITKLQLLFHKIVRWFAIPIFFLALFLGGLTDLLNNDCFSYITIFFLFVWGITLFSLFVSKLTRVKIPVLAMISYAFLVHYHSGLGAIKAFWGERVSQWGKAASNR